MKRDDEQIARQVGEWVAKDLHHELPRCRAANFEAQLCSRLAQSQALPRSTFRRHRLVLTTAACAMLIVAVGVFVRIQRPDSRPPLATAGAIHTFFEHSPMLHRLQTAPSAPAIAQTNHSTSSPTAEPRPSKGELVILIRRVLPAHELAAGRIAIVGSRVSGTSRLSQTIDRFFVDRLKSIKEEQNG